MSIDNNKQLTDIKNIDNLESLTDKNWLFIKYLFTGLSVLASYQAAGYDSKEPSAPYVLHSRLKKSIEKIVESDGVDRIRLLMEAKKLLAIPLNPEKVTLTFSEKLRSLKLLASVVPEPKESAKVNITNFTINRYNSQESSEIIDVPGLPVE